jgi:ubiquinone biosynthesis monooxygenase Coq6
VLAPSRAPPLRGQESEALTMRYYSTARKTMTHSSLLCCCRSNHAQVWEHAGPGYISWNASDVGRDLMGVVVENRLLQAALLRAATAAPNTNVELLHPVKVKALDLPGGDGQSKSRTRLTIHKGTSSSSSSTGSTGGTGGDGNRLAALHLEDGSVLRCRLVIGADGARSKVRNLDSPKP